jgi:predicted GH43/DUF377 family glycosyl hydrolase
MKKNNSLIEKHSRGGVSGGNQGGARSRREFLAGATTTAIAAALTPLSVHAQQVRRSPKQSANPQHANGMFDWQFPSQDAEKTWKERSFSIDRWWGTFSRELPNQMHMFTENRWAVGPFVKYAGNPVLAPTPGAWDEGLFDNGVHNGSILVRDNRFYYIYRGSHPIDIPQKSSINYICDIGLAVSDDGMHFIKDTQHSPFFRRGEDRKYSYEDVNASSYGDTYYLFCNQWLWERQGDTSINGTFLATSKDLLHWEKHGIVFPRARRIHRNAVVVQNPRNEAVGINGKFVMYINDGLIAYSTDMVHWESHRNPHRWPGGECCFALTDYDPERPDDILLFTGGAHTGHFYAVGEVLFSKADPEKPLHWLPRSPLFAEPKYPFEHGFTATAPHKLISSFSDCIFFNGLTRHERKWWLYYGGSEYYTCLATSLAQDRM